MLIDILLIGGASLAILCFIVAVILAIKVDNNPPLMTNRKIMRARFSLSIITIVGLGIHSYTLVNTENTLREYITLITIGAIIIAYICIRWIRILSAELFGDNS